MDTQEQQFTVEGLSCEGCVGAIAAAAQHIPGVVTCDVELVAGGQSTLTITSTTEAADVIAEFADAGYDLVPKQRSQ